MSTTTELCETLASSLGIEPEVVADHAKHLHEAGGRFPTGEDGADAAPAEPEQAAVLLISLMSGLPPAKAPDAVRLYGGLPLDSAHRGVTRPDGQWVGEKLQGDDPFMETLTAWGDTFGEFLSCLIAWFNEAPEINFEVMSFVLGGGKGNASVLIYFAALIEGENVMGDVKFSLAPLGGGFLPDDAPRARLERQALVPGTILPILRQCFTGNTDGPREVFTSRADLVCFSKEGHS